MDLGPEWAGIVHLSVVLRREDGLRQISCRWAPADFLLMGSSF